ncbi:unnamed protein product [Rotaria socialis]|uniref:WWE domain-containing protein n=1 Tax=Rotaria socialis TaxID=392032 RepID=A0A821UC12_9BILA|nr:unnamed protein product [Rotaria socialis]CAF3616353.1 unnamed protein product [Rotaria socialis]CAF4626736.1 unnamed protein product [Rotaria socialis]CAF4887580.1 unnamed protein product [Rotaria socialis]
MANEQHADVEFRKLHIIQYQWAWKANPELLLATSDNNEWTSYSDIDNEIIEEAYHAKEKCAILDDCYIDFEKQIAVYYNSEDCSQPVRRTEHTEKNFTFREDRFMPNPTVPHNSFVEVTDFREPIFLKNLVDVSKLGREEINQKVCELVEPAIAGILKEGELSGKTKQAKWISAQLRNVKDKSPKEIGECCINLYTRECFLYRVLNQTMRLCGERGQEHAWFSKVDTLGPFAAILFHHIISEGRCTDIAYRGALLSEANIQEFRDLASNGKWKTRSFQSFVSCSRNPAIANLYGNVLFEIRVSRTFRTMNISPLSRFPDEEELLLPAGVSFGVESVQYKPAIGKHVIKLWIPIFNPRDD